MLSLSSSAQRLLLTLVEDELARRETIIKQDEEQFVAYRELSACGLAYATDNLNALWYFQAYLTDSGKYYFGQLMANARIFTTSNTSVSSPVEHGRL